MNVVMVIKFLAVCTIMYKNTSYNSMKPDARRSINFTVSSREMLVLGIFSQSLNISVCLYPQIDTKNQQVLIENAQF